MFVYLYTLKQFFPIHCIFCSILWKQ